MFGALENRCGSFLIVVWGEADETWRAASVSSQQAESLVILWNKSLLPVILYSSVPLSHAVSIPSFTTFLFLHDVSSSRRLPSFCYLNIINCHKNIPFSSPDQLVGICNELLFKFQRKLCGGLWDKCNHFKTKRVRFYSVCYFKCAEILPLKTRYIFCEILRFCSAGSIFKLSSESDRCVLTT